MKDSVTISDSIHAPGQKSRLQNCFPFVLPQSPGGVSSEFDPLHMQQYSPAEIRAAVAVADQWKTYVTTHSFTDDAVRMAVEDGVRCIEHVPFISDEVAELLEKEGIFVEVNLSTVLGRPLSELQQILSPSSFAKLKIAIDGMTKAMVHIGRHKDIKLVYGSDLVAPWDKTMSTEARLQLGEFAILEKYVGALRELRAATSLGGELAALTGPNNPWQEGPLGVVEEGAYADLLIVDSNPLEDISVMGNAGNFRVIMKDGIIYRNTL